jgi:hypothetical protein
MFALGSCRVKGMRTYLPRNIDFSFLENHLHSPHELLQWLNIVFDLENLSSMPDEFLSTLFSYIDEVHLREAYSTSDTIKRYMISLRDLLSSEVVLAEVSSAKVYASNYLSYNGMSIHANILCMNAMQNNLTGGHLPERARIMNFEEVKSLVKDFLEHPIIKDKKVILVPHFQFDIPGKGFIKERRIIQEALMSIKANNANGESLAIYDPSLLADELGVEDLILDSSHYNKDRLWCIADKISAIATDLFKGR